MTLPAAQAPRYKLDAGAVERAAVVLLFALFAAIFVLVIRAPGTEDVAIWHRTMNVVAQDGLVAGYGAFPFDLAPLLVVIWWGCDQLAAVLHLAPLLILKGYMVAAAFASVAVFYAWVRSALFTTGLFLIIINNLALGYLDILFLPFLLLSLWLLQLRRQGAAMLFYGIACSIKWQPLIIGPFLVLHLMRPDFRAGLRALIPTALIAMLALAVLGGEVPLALAHALGHSDLSGQALNFWWIVSWALEAANIGGRSLDHGMVDVIHLDSYLWRGLSKLAFVPFYLLVLRRQWRAAPPFAGLTGLMAVGFLTYFTLNTAVHENHLYVACVLALVAAAFDSRFTILFVLTALFNAVNLMLFYGLDGQGLGFSRVHGVDVTVPFAALMVAVWAYYWWSTIAAPAARYAAVALPDDAVGVTTAAQLH